jgi:hypothetical protein
MMYSMNLWSCLWSSIGILATGEFNGLFDFLQTYPYVMSNILLLSLTGAIGQVKKTNLEFRKQIRIFLFRILFF